MVYRTLVVVVELYCRSSEVLVQYARCMGAPFPHFYLQKKNCVDKWGKLTETFGGGTMKDSIALILFFSAFACLCNTVQYKQR